MNNYAQQLTGTPTKLRDGSWGVRFTTHHDAETVRAWPMKAVEVKVTTRAGKSWMAPLASVIWHGEDRATGVNAVIARTGESRSTARKPSRPKSTSRRCTCCRSCKCWAGNTCWNCGCDCRD